MTVSKSRQRTKFKHKKRSGGSRRGLRRFKVISGIALLLLGVASWLWWDELVPVNQSAQDWYEVSSQDHLLVSLPKDDAPHPDAYTEWWYYNGHLQTSDGKHYSFHYTIFLLNALATHTVIHASLVDQQTGKHFSYQYRNAGNSSHGSQDGFHFSQGGWLMSGSNGVDKLRSGAPDFSFDLNLTSISPVVYQGGTGLLDFAQAGTSYYYSRTRMQVSGIAGPKGSESAVTGQAWFDHQWGDFRATALRWDWFAIQLNDGADIMLYQLYTSEGVPVLISGTYSKAGETRLLTEDQFMIEDQAYWTSKKSKIKYPIKWRIKVPDQGVNIVLSPVLKASEFDARHSTYGTYWEGAVNISGTETGLGFVEMFGYKRE